MSDYPRTIDNGAGERLIQLYASKRATGGKRSRRFDVAHLPTRYRAEFGMAVPPRPLQRGLFPIVLAVCRLFGRHRRFAGAPEPVSR